MVAKAKKKTKNKPINTSLISINAAPVKQIWKKYKGVIIAIILVVSVVGWYFSDFWPWPSKERIQNRMDSVLEACIDNEDSSKCKNLLQRYNMTFKYCSNLADYMVLKQKYPDFSDLFNHMSELKRYGVVWEGKSDKPPETTYNINGRQTTSPSMYYSCSDHIK